MKIYHVVLFLFPWILYSQNTFPSGLEGSWKLQGKDEYEHWDKLDDHHYQGVYYKVKNGHWAVSEYLELAYLKNKWVYTATVIGQNKGKSISFRSSKNGNPDIFINEKHDFPNKIEYQYQGENEINVAVSDGKGKGFKKTFQRVGQRLSTVDSTLTNPSYDADLAQALGADDYGMKRYVLVILRSGSNDTTDQNFIQSCFKDHIKNIGKLAAEKKLIVAGPAGKNALDCRGIFILNSADFEEAKKMMEADSAIKHGLLEPVLISWYGSAALPLYMESTDKVWKVKF